VDRGVAHDTLEAARDVDDLPRDRVLVDRGAQRLALREALLEGRRPPLLGVGDQLRETVPHAVVVAEHAGRIARCLARRHLAEGDDLRDRLAAVLLDHVAQHALAAAHREVDVDVRHRHALGVQEALKHEVVGERVDIGDPQAVGDDRAGRRAAARADRDAVALREVDEVPDDQEVGVEAHPVDDRELGLHALERRGGRRVAVALAQALLDEPAQEAAVGLALRDGVGRDQLAVELDLDVAALGDLEGRGERLRPLRERARHLLVVLEVELVGFEADLGLGERALGLHAQERRVVVVVLATQVMDIAGADQRGAGLARETNDLLVAAVLQLEAVALQLEVDVLAPEHADQLVDVGARVVQAPVGDPRAQPRGQAAGERDQPAAEALDLRHVDRGLAALEALEEAGRGELDEVAVARVAGGEQRQVVVLEPLTGRRDRRVIVDEVDLAADDRLDPGGARRLVELDRSVHHAVVGEPEGGLPERRRTLDEAGDLRGAVEQ